MTQDGVVPDRQDRREPPSLAADLSVAHREYATAQDVQAATADTVVDGPAAEPHRQQLPQRYNAELNGGKTRDLGVCRRLRTTTHVGDSAPLASSRPQPRVLSRSCGHGA